MVAAAQNVTELSPYRGLSPRARRLLDLRAWVEDTQYADREYEWTESEKAGRYVPAAKRKPSVLSGLAATKVGRLVEKLTGEGRLPTFVITDPGAAEDAESQAAEDFRQLLWADGLDLAESLVRPVTDLVALAAGCFGFHQTVGSSRRHLGAGAGAAARCGVALRRRRAPVHLGS